MRWFKTPQEYLEDFDGYIVIPDREPGPLTCPKCGNHNMRKLETVHDPRGWRFLRWRCKRWSCGHVWNPYTMERRIVRTPEEHVFQRIKGTYDGGCMMLRMVGHLPGGTQVKGPGILDGLAAVGALTGNLETIKDSALLEGTQMYGRHQQRQAQQSEVAQFDAEHEYALQLADRYFHISDRQAMAEQAVRREEIRELGRVLAQEIVTEVRRQSGAPS